MLTTDSQQHTQEVFEGLQVAANLLEQRTMPRSPSLLVIHHEKETRLMLTEYLQLGGYEVFSAQDWETAAEQLQQQPIDLVILDLAVSHKAQGSLLNQMLTLYPTVRVVMICDRCSLEEAVEAMKQGAIDFIQESHGFLQRPFEPEQIQAVVAEALNHPLTHAAYSTNYDDLMMWAQQAARQCNFDQARELIGEAVKQAPQRPEGLTLLGQITEYVDDRVEALKLYRAAIGLDPTYQPAQQNLERAVNSCGKKRPRFEI